jgi:DNA-directed RNA polymerase sigma subunit (sigma70/sigma32)
VHKVQKGGREARQAKEMEANLRLVISIARSTNRGCSSST